MLRTKAAGAWLAPALAMLLMACVNQGAVAQTTAQTPAPQAQRVQYGKLFVVTYRPGAAWLPGRPMSEQGLLPHGRYVRGLFDAGKIFAGGGFTVSDGGMMIVRAAALSEVQAIIAADPAVTSGIFVGQIEEWTPRFFGAGPLMIPAS